ncbi:MAG TPA: Spy/CpxP family protein refolding chaperone [Pseudolabrys sp.]|nr:Spy/CpxP family protein refolding chaperone [Pseudolabrys sp.]
MLAIAKVFVLAFGAVLSAAAANAQPMMGWGGWGPGMMMGPGAMSQRQFGMMCDPRSAGFAQWSFDRIERSVKLTETQSAALSALKTASSKADEVIRNSCPTEWPLTTPGRLAAMEKRHEAILEASKIIRPALDAFYATLTDEQKRRFDAAGPASGGWQGRGWWYRG